MPGKMFPKYARKKEKYFLVRKKLRKVLRQEKNASEIM